MSRGAEKTKSLSTKDIVFDLTVRIEILERRVKDLERQLNLL